MNQIAPLTPAAYTQTTVYVLHANKGYIGGDYKLTFATPELRDAHELPSGHRKLATGREFRYSDVDHSKPALLEQRIQQAAHAACIALGLTEMQIRASSLEKERR